MRKKTHLKSNFLVNIRRLSPWIVIRIVFTWLLLFPWFLVVFSMSWIKMRHWRKAGTCRNFIGRHPLAFKNIKPETLRVESLSGGVSNSNQIWYCETHEGQTKKYFVKVFVSIGSFWAKNMSLVSPFPEIYGVSTRERFTVDCGLQDHFVVRIFEQGTPEIIHCKKRLSDRDSEKRSKHLIED